MNPALILAALFFLSQNQGKTPFRLPPPSALGGLGIPSIKDPGYFDTFRMEMLLDRLHNMTNTLEKVNHLNQLKGVPINRDNSIDRIQESLEAVKGLLYTNKNTKGNKKIDNLSSTLSNVKQLGDVQNIMTNMGPILSMLSNKNDK